MRQAHGFHIVGHANADEHAAAGVARADVEARGSESLEQGFAQRFAHAQHFAGGFHFRAERAVGVRQFLEGEHGHFHREIRRRLVQARSVAQRAQRRAHHHARGDIHHGHARDLTDVGNRARGARVHFDDVQFPAVDEVLDVHQAARAQRERELGGAIQDGASLLIGEAIGRIHGDGVAAVHARALDMLHNAGDQHIRAIGNRVHFQFRAAHIFIHQHRVLNALCQNQAHVGHHIGVRLRDGHVLPANHVRGAQQHRIAQPVGRGQRAIHIHGGRAFGPADAQRLQEMIEPFAVFRQVDALRRSA